MTSVLMIFEMTQDYAVIVPLMIANLVSLFMLHVQRAPLRSAGGAGWHPPADGGDAATIWPAQVMSVMQTASEALAGGDHGSGKLWTGRSSEVRTWLVTIDEA